MNRYGTYEGPRGWVGWVGFPEGGAVTETADTYKSEAEALKAIKSEHPDKAAPVKKAAKK